MTLSARREVAQQFRERFAMSERRSVQLSQLNRSTARYQSCRREDPAIRRRLLELAALRPRHGYELLWLQLRREGFLVNRKRILRRYRLERLSLRQKPRKKLVAASAAPTPRGREAPVKIKANSTLETVAIVVGDALAENGIRAVLTGGACAGIYSGGLYSSQDVDFVLEGRVTPASLYAVMATLGFFLRPNRNCPDGSAART